MMPQPIYATEYRITFGQRRLQRHELTGQSAPLLVNTRLKSAMAGR
jgi:hypothetical protein